MLVVADRSNPFVSVDCGALDNCAAKSALPGWAPVALDMRVRESVDWWVTSNREQIAVPVGGTRAEPQAEGTGSLAALAVAPVAPLGEASDFRFGFDVHEASAS